MQSPERQLVRVFVATPTAVTAARHAILNLAQRLRASPVTCENLALAVSEGVANAVRHAYPGGAKPGAVEVRATVAGDQLRLVIADYGRGMTARADGSGMGMGIALMASVSRHLEVRERRGGGVELEMIFTLDSGR
ncbi:MAG: ATP-binding protein [Trebonia sp.]